MNSATPLSDGAWPEARSPRAPKFHVHQRTTTMWSLAVSFRQVEVCHWALECECCLEYSLLLHRYGRPGGERDFHCSRGSPLIIANTSSVA